jgi:AcrR family transcriptional regulator
MPKTKGASPSERLFAATMSYVAKHGIGELTLRRLAAAIGASHRMLVYHFGSKEGLLTEVVRRFEAEERAFAAQILADRETPPVEQARRIWKQLAEPDMAPRERLFFEVYAQALQGRPHTRALLDEIVDAWLAPLIEVNLRNGMPPGQAEPAARVGLAITRGLLLDLLATGDRKAVDAAMEHFLANYLPWSQARRVRGDSDR